MSKIEPYHKIFILTQEAYKNNQNLVEQIEGANGIIRNEWPKVFEDPEYSGWMSGVNEHPIRLFLTDGKDGVLSHAGIIERRINNGGEGFTFLGLGGVIVKPDMRGRGYGWEVASIATSWIRRSATIYDVDVAMLSCGQAHTQFYSVMGWELVDDKRGFLFGQDSVKAVPHSENIMTIPLSGKGEELIANINRRAKSLYFGKPF